MSQELTIPVVSKGAAVVLPAAGGWRDFLKAPGTSVVLAVSLAEMLLLGIWSPWSVTAAALALLAAVGSYRVRGLLLVALGLLVVGAGLLLHQAPVTVFIAFSYPAIFAACIVIAQTGRLFEALLALVGISASATLVLDTFQQQLSFGHEKVIVLASMWATGEEKQPILEELIGEFQRKYPEYRVVVRFDGRWVLSKNRPWLLTRKDVPDIIEGSKEELRILVRENYALPLDEYLDKPSAQTGRPWREDWIPDLLEMGRYQVKPGQPGEALNGKMAIASGIIYNILFFYNKAILHNLGVEKTPETWEEFKGVCEKALAAGVIPIMLDSDYKDMVADTLLQASLPDGEMRKTVLGEPGHKPFTDEMYVRVFRLERELADQYLLKGWQGSVWPKGQQEFATGKGLFMMNGSWLPGKLHTTAVKDKKVFELGVMPIPRFKEDRPGTFVIANSGWMVLKDGKQTEGAIKLLEFLTDRFGEPIAMKDANPTAFARSPQPVELNEIAEAMAHRSRAVNDPLSAYAPKWRSFIYVQLHSDFFQATPDSPKHISPEEFARRLEQATEQYRANGGEEQWK